ncbi:MAG: metallophosphoesterase family protein [Clostridia bacterium]|nr:metallophosphoesterase family protein [Clostridia bacterium]
MQLHFKDGRFKIMQITDTQEVSFVSPDTVKLIELALDREQPDLVVFTGDQIKGYSSTFRGHTMQKLDRVLSVLLAPLEQRSIPFCVTFGNHDDNCGVANHLQMPLYAKHAGFVQGTPRCNTDQGTFALPIFDSDNRAPAFCLYLIDSGKKNRDGIYPPVTPDQIAWYKAERDRLHDACGRYVPALVFQHVPLPEYFDVLVPAKKRQKGAVEAFYSHADEFYVLPDAALERGDFMLESPAAADWDGGEFAALKEQGDVLGVFVGHDHNNSFVLPYQGIDLGYTQGAGFHVYGPGKKRGVRVFELDEGGSYTTRTVTMDMLCDFRPANPVGEYVLTHAPTSPNQVTRHMPKLLAGIGAVTAAAVLLKKKR